MLRFRLEQIHLASLGRYFLPLPKMAGPSLELLLTHLQQRGYRVAIKGENHLAVKGSQSISIRGSLGLATSSVDMLDAIGPAIPALLGSRERVKEEVGPRYFSVKGPKDHVQVQFFPRMESSRTWTCLRKEGLAGLTPDEALAIRHALARAGERTIECITESPRDGSQPLQLGRRIYYKSSLAAPELATSLRTLAEKARPPVSYLPRDAILRLSLGSVPPLACDNLGEWCCL